MVLVRLCCSGSVMGRGSSGGCYTLEGQGPILMLEHCTLLPRTSHLSRCTLSLPSAMSCAICSRPLDALHCCITLHGSMGAASVAVATQRSWPRSQTRAIDKERNNYQPACRLSCTRRMRPLCSVSAAITHCFPHAPPRRQDLPAQPRLTTCTWAPAASCPAACAAGRCPAAWPCPRLTQT